MADYWKSIDKKYCDVCKCWLTDNKASVAFHENGNRHKMNIQNRLKEIHKKNKTDMKSEKKFDKEMRKIEQAALAASAKDMQDNPDVSMKIQTYVNMLKESKGADKTEEESPSTSKKSNQPTILHRSEKQKKADDTIIENMNKSVKGYQRLGGWDTPQTSGTSKNFLELPTKNTKSPGASLQWDAKLRDEEPVKFGVKTVGSMESSSIKSESGEVAFKKRKLNKGTARRRNEDDN